MPGLKTSYDFTLPRGYVDPYGNVHRIGRMRLATARDELEPLRDPSVTGPDDPRLTILVLARVVEKLGELGWVTPEHIEGLFAVDLAFLQDFYGVINFGTQQEFDALMAAQDSQSLVNHADDVQPEPVHDQNEALPDELVEDEFDAAEAEGDEADFDPRPVFTRASVEELPNVAQ